MKQVMVQLVRNFPGNHVVNKAQQFLRVDLGTGY